MTLTRPFELIRAFHGLDHSSRVGACQVDDPARSVILENLLTRPDPTRSMRFTTLPDPTRLYPRVFEKSLLPRIRLTRGPGHDA